jgi:hypothetical protein
MFTRLRSLLRRRRTLRVPTRRPLDRFMFFDSLMLELADVHLSSTSPTCLSHISTATVTRGGVAPKKVLVGAFYVFKTVNQRGCRPRRATAHRTLL